MSKFDDLALPVDEITSRCEFVRPGTSVPLTDGDGNRAFVELLSLDSAPARKVEERIGKRRLGKRRFQMPSTEDLEAERIERLAAVTTAWHIVSLTGEAVGEPCTPDNAAELYGHPGWGWLRRQVEDHLADETNFTPASPRA